MQRSLFQRTASRRARVTLELSMSDLSQFLKVGVAHQIGVERRAMPTLQVRTYFESHGGI